MDLTITKTSYTQDPEWLMSDHKVHRPGGVTIAADAVTAVDGKKIVKAGTPIGKNASTGKWEPYNGNDETPNVTPTDLLFNTVDCTAGDQAAGSIIHGFVNEDRLPVTITEACKQNMPQIAFLKY